MIRRALVPLVLGPGTFVIGLFFAIRERVGRKSRQSERDLVQRKLDPNLQKTA
jgi:hypothetical protein